MKGQVLKATAAATVGLLLGTGLIAAAVWLHQYTKVKSLYDGQAYGYVDPVWAEPAAAAAAILGGALVLVALARLLRRS